MVARHGGGISRFYTVVVDFAGAIIVPKQQFSKGNYHEDCEKDGEVKGVSRSLQPVAEAKEAVLAPILGVGGCCG